MSRESIYKRYVPAIISPQGESNQNHWFVFSQNRLLVRVDGEKTEIPYSKNFAELDLAPIRTQYLGQLQQSPCYSVEIAPGSVAPKGMAFIDLGSLYDAVDEDIFLLAGKAHQISELGPDTPVLRQMRHQN